MPSPEPIHTEDHVEIHVGGKTRRVKRLRYLGEIWVPLSVVDELIAGEPGNVTEKGVQDGASGKDGIE